MHVFRPVDYTPATLVGRGLRVLLVSANGGLADRVARLGGSVVVEDRLADALAALADPAGAWGLLVIDAEVCGGLAAARQAVAAVSGGLPVIITAAGVAGQVFPEDPAEPVVLRAPASAVSLRVAVEHALRDRLTAAA